MNYVAHVRISLVVCVNGSFCDVVVNSVYTVVRVQIDKERWCNSVLFQKAVSHRTHTVAPNGEEHNIHLLDQLSVVIVGKYLGAISLKLKLNWVIIVDLQQEYIGKMYNDFCMSGLRSSHSQV